MLGVYDSDDEVAAAAEAEVEKQVIAVAAQASLTAAAATASGRELKPPPGSRGNAGRMKRAACELEQEAAEQVYEETTGEHGPNCECEDCGSLLARFCGKSLQTKGIRFKCKLCGDMMGRKDQSTGHFLQRHAADLQAFKRQKEPVLFAKKPKVTPGKPKISFSRDDVLGKRRTIDEEDVNFGDWAKKEKPEPPPCESEEFQDQMREAADAVITAPPWMAQSKPDDSDATPEDQMLDKQVLMAQMTRFTSRNVMVVKADTVRCKLCYQTHKSEFRCEQHIISAHQEEFAKEGELWNRFCHTSSKRQPPFGWACKICQLLFPTDGAAWRHLGKACFILKEMKHADLWRQKEDKWGHEEDGECCGDGMNVARGLSYDSVKLFNEEANKASRAPTDVPGRDDASSSDDDEKAGPRPEPGRQKITEF